MMNLSCWTVVYYLWKKDGTSRSLGSNSSVSPGIRVRRTNLPDRILLLKLVWMALIGRTYRCCSATMRGFSVREAT